jgi:hypothetical protein
MRTLRHDKSGEQTSTAMDTWCVDNNIVAQPTITDSHEQNGVVERKIGVLSQMTRALMLQGWFPKAAYFELFSTSNFLQDRLPTVAHDWVSAFEVSERKSYPFHGLRVVGCDAYVHTPGGAKAQAMPSRRKGKLIGYSSDSHGYRVLMDATTGEIVESTDVTFHETTTVPGGVLTTVITSAADDENPVESRYPDQTASPPPRRPAIADKQPQQDAVSPVDNLSPFEAETPWVDWNDGRLSNLEPLGDRTIRRRLEDDVASTGSDDPSTIDADTPWLAHEGPRAAIPPESIPPQTDIPVRIVPKSKGKAKGPPPTITMTRAQALRQQATDATKAAAAAHAYRAVVAQFPTPTTHPHIYSADEHHTHALKVGAPARMKVAEAMALPHMRDTMKAEIEGRLADGSMRWTKIPKRARCCLSRVF